MTQDELLKKCVDRGVADETTVTAVSHLFYVFLLSALQRGQRVEIPDFGTFGTRVVGVKRSRKMPFFEPDSELAEQVNERYRELKYVVIGKCEITPLVGETAYEGKEAPYDSLVEQIGKQKVLDTHHDVLPEEYIADVRRKDQLGPPTEEYIIDMRQKDRLTPQREKPSMPKFNLKEEGAEGEPGKEAPAPQPHLHEAEEGGGMNSLTKVLIAVALLVIVTLALHFFGIIRLWGPGPAKEVALPEPVPTIMPQEQKPLAGADTTPVPGVVTPTPVPVEKPRPAIVASGTGNFTVQVSSWLSRSKADEEVSRLVGAGLDAFVEEGAVGGAQRHRVRVGRYTTQKEAGEAAARLREILENGAWVARVGS